MNWLAEYGPWIPVIFLSLAGLGCLYLHRYITSDEYDPEIKKNAAWLKFLAGFFFVLAVLAALRLLWQHF